MYLRVNPYDEILRGMRVSLQIDEGIIKLTGRNGSGKSALCRQLYDDLQGDGQPALLFAEPPSSAAALQDAIVDWLNLDSAGNFTRSLSAWLLANNADEKPLVLIFDDAQRLDPPTFSAIRMLCNIQNGARALVRVVLCGNDELDVLLASTALRAVTQFISQSFTVPYLKREQARDFHQAWCLQSGLGTKALDERALDRLFHGTKGQPGLLFARCEQEGAAQQLPVGTPAAETVPVDALVAAPGGGKQDRPRALAIVIALLLIGGAAYVYLAPPATTITDPVAPSEAQAAPSPGPPSNAVDDAIVTESAPEVMAGADSPEPDAPPPSAVITAMESRAPADQAASMAPPAEPTQSAEPAIAAQSTRATLVEATPEAMQDTAAPPDSRIAAGQPEPAAGDVQRVTAGVEPAPVDAAQSMAPPLPVEEFIASWIDTWQAQDVEAYLAHYHRDFAPIQGTREGWEEQRRRVIANARDIMISADAPQSIAEAQDGMRVVRFWLNYSAANYADRTLKELVLARDEDTWRIRVERNLRSEPQ